MSAGWGVVAVALVATLTGSALAETVVVVDSAGRTVAVEQPVEHIASAYGIGTYYVYALGAGDRLVAAWFVGVKSAAQAPASLRAIEPRLDTLLRAGEPNVEDLAARGAELVLADNAKYGAVAVPLGEVGIPTLVLGAETLSSIADVTQLLGSVLGETAAARGRALLADMDRVRTTTAAVATGVAVAERPRVLFLGASPSQVASGAMYQTQLIEAAGGLSVSADLAGAWNTVGMEQILVWNPDVIVIPSYGAYEAADLMSHPDWQSIGAIRSGRVAKMPRVFGTMDTPIPESMLGILWLADLLYPERATFDVAAEAAAFYRTFYSYDLTPEEADAFLIP